MCGGDARLDGGLYMTVADRTETVYRRRGRAIPYAKCYLAPAAHYLLFFAIGWGLYLWLAPVFSEHACLIFEHFRSLGNLPPDFSALPALLVPVVRVECLILFFLFFAGFTYIPGFLGNAAAGYYGLRIGLSMAYTARMLLDGALSPKFFYVFLGVIAIFSANILTFAGRASSFSFRMGQLGGKQGYLRVAMAFRFSARLALYISWLFLSAFIFSLIV